MRAREAGVSDPALRDAIHICALFSTIVRVADGLGFDLIAAEDLQLSARDMLRRGYRI